MSTRSAPPSYISWPNSIFSGHDDIEPSKPVITADTKSHMAGSPVLSVNLRLINIGCAIMLSILCSIILTEPDYYGAFFGIVLAPAWLSVVFAAITTFSLRAQSSRIATVLELVLAVFHAVMFVLVTMWCTGSYYFNPYVILGIWTSVFLLIDFLVHAALFLKQLTSMLRNRFPQGPICQRCGDKCEDLSKDVPLQSVPSVPRLSQIQSKEGCSAVGGNFVAESNFGDDSSITISESTS